MVAAGPRVYDDYEQAMMRKRRWPWVFLVLLLLAGGGVGGLYYFDRPTFHRLLAMVVGQDARANTQAVSHLEAGKEQYRKDTFNDFDEALREFEKAVTLEPEFAEALAVAAETHLAYAEYLREDGDTIEHLLKTEAKKLAPEQMAEYATQLAKKQSAAAERSERAFALAKKARELEPDLLEANRAMAAYYAFKGTAESMKPFIERVRAAQQSDAGILYVLGLSNLADDATTNVAAQYFTKAVEQDPRYLHARYRLAQVLLRQKARDQALEQLDAILAANPNHKRAANLKQEAGVPPEVKAAPKEEPKETPKEPADPDKLAASYLARAERLRRADRASQALPLYEKLLDLEPDNVEGHAGMGWSYFDMESFPAALAEFKQALKLSPRFADAHFGLAECYRAMGRSEDAIRHFERYLAISPNGDEAVVARNALSQLKGQ